MEISTRIKARFHALEPYHLAVVAALGGADQVVTFIRSQGDDFDRRLQLAVNGDISANMRASLFHLVSVVSLCQALPTLMQPRQGRQWVGVDVVAEAVRRCAGTGTTDEALLGTRFVQ